MNSTQKWSKDSHSNMLCFGCGEKGHFQNECDKIKLLIELGKLKVTPDGKVRLPGGAVVPNIPQGAPLNERTEHYYANRLTQSFYGTFEEVVMSLPMLYKL